MTIRLIAGIVIGAAAGYAYYRFIGCSTGACPLTSHPVRSTIYGAVMGALISGAMKDPAPSRGVPQENRRMDATRSGEPDPSERPEAQSPIIHKK